MEPRLVASDALRRAGGRGCDFEDLATHRERRGGIAQRRLRQLGQQQPRRHRPLVECDRGAEVGRSLVVAAETGGEDAQGFALAVLGAQSVEELLAAGVLVKDEDGGDAWNLGGAVESLGLVAAMNQTPLVWEKRRIPAMQKPKFATSNPTNGGRK